jgi:hypothetical protein
LTTRGAAGVGDGAIAAEDAPGATGAAKSGAVFWMPDGTESGATGAWTFTTPRMPIALAPEGWGPLTTPRGPAILYPFMRRLNQSWTGSGPVGGIIGGVTGTAAAGGRAAALLGAEGPSMICPVGTIDLD